MQIRLTKCNQSSETEETSLENRGGDQSAGNWSLSWMPQKFNNIFVNTRPTNWHRVKVSLGTTSTLQSAFVRSICESFQLIRSLVMLFIYFKMGSWQEHNNYQNVLFVSLSLSSSPPVKSLIPFFPGILAYLLCVQLVTFILRGKLNHTELISNANPLLVVFHLRQLRVFFPPSSR